MEVKVEERSRRIEPPLRYEPERGHTHHTARRHTVRDLGDVLQDVEHKLDDDGVVPAAASPAVHHGDQHGVQGVEVGRRQGLAVAPGNKANLERKKTCHCFSGVRGSWETPPHTTHRLKFVGLPLFDKYQRRKKNETTMSVSCLFCEKQPLILFSPLGSRR